MKRFLALGDSYTIGEDIPADACWPAQLVARLREAGALFDDADRVAKTGWTTDELQRAIDGRTFSPPYDLVSLLIGVNNQYRGRDLENYQTEYTVLLDFAIAMAGGVASQVIGVSIPDWSVTRFASDKGVDDAKVADEIDRFNRIACDVATARGVAWIDICGISRREGRHLLAPDGLHPSAQHYAMWVDSILPVAAAIVHAASTAPASREGGVAAIDQPGVIS